MLCFARYAPATQRAYARARVAARREVRERACAAVARGGSATRYGSAFEMLATLRLIFFFSLLMLPLMMLDYAAARHYRYAASCRCFR